MLINDRLDLVSGKRYEAHELIQIWWGTEGKIVILIIFSVIKFSFSFILPDLEGIKIPSLFILFLFPPKKTLEHTFNLDFSYFLFFSLQELLEYTVLITTNMVQCLSFYIPRSIPIYYEAIILHFIQSSFLIGCSVVLSMVHLM